MHPLWTAPDGSLPCSLSLCIAPSLMCTAPFPCALLLGVQCILSLCNVLCVDQGSLPRVARDEQSESAGRFYFTGRKDQKKAENRVLKVHYYRSVLV